MTQLIILKTLNMNNLHLQLEVAKELSGHLVLIFNALNTGKFPED